jgi:hypothetical protein
MRMTRILLFFLSLPSEIDDGDRSLSGAMGKEHRSHFEKNPGYSNQ